MLRTGMINCSDAIGLFFFFWVITWRIELDKIKKNINIAFDYLSDAIGFFFFFGKPLRKS